MATHLSVNELDYKEGAADFLNALYMLGKKIGVATTITNYSKKTYEKS